MIDYSKDIILANNLSLRRNIEGYNFPLSLGEDESLEILEAFRKIYKDELVEIENLDENTLNSLIETEVLSEDCLNRQAKVGLVFKDDYIITINDIDHLAINVRNFDYDITSAFSKACMVEEFLDKKFDFAFSPEFGYLTSQGENTGSGLSLSYKLFLFALIDSSQAYLAMKSILAHSGIYFSHYKTTYNKKYPKDIYRLKNFGNYRPNMDDYLEEFDNKLHTVLKNELKFRRDYKALNSLNDDDIKDKIKIVEDNLKIGNYRSFYQMLEALYELKKYKDLGFKMKLSIEEIDFLIFNLSKNKYKSDRDRQRYEFLNSYIKERYDGQ